MEVREFLDILATAERLKDTIRHSYTSKGRPESVAEHSWRMALMAMLLKDELKDIDIDKVIKMCLIHDLGEAFTGDVPVFLKTPADRDREELDLKNWLASLNEETRSQLAVLFDEMEGLRTREAKVYKAIDKLEALIQHNEADISTWIELEYELQLTYGVEACQCEPYMERLRQEVKKDSENKMEQKIKVKQ